MKSSNDDFFFDMMMLLIIYQRLVVSLQEQPSYRDRSYRYNDVSGYAESGVLDLASFFFLTQESNTFVHSRYKKEFLKSLGDYDKCLRQRRIPRLALQDPTKSSWMKLYKSQEDSSMITLTGLDHAASGELNEKFCILFNKYTPYTKSGIIELRKNTSGRKRSMRSCDCLALSLAWTRTRGSCFVLQMIFGLSRSVVSLFVRFGRRILIEVLKNDPSAKLQMPSPNKIQEYIWSIEEKHQSLKDVWCTMDGLKLYIESSPDCTEQTNFYNGWTHDTYVGNVLVFCPDGTIPFACTNIPGCVHDSTIAEWGNIYQNLEKVYESCGGKCTVDSAFSRQKHDCLIKSSQIVPTGTSQEIIVNTEATAMRQSAEWGMRAIQASFPRIKDRIK